MKYSVKFPTTSIADKFNKELKGIPSKKLQDEILAETLALADNPRPYGAKKIRPPTEVYQYIAEYRIRINDYRVLYDIDDRKKTVWIYALRKRTERTYR